MKKFIVFLALMSLIPSSVYAIDFDILKQKAVNVVATQAGVSVSTNYKQLQAEKEFQAKWNTQEMRLLLHCSLFQEDKSTYNEDKHSDTIYGELLGIIAKQKKLSLITPDLEYAQKAKNLFDILADATPESKLTPQEFEKIKIIIPDSDFDKIDTNLKEIIFSLNTY